MRQLKVNDGVDSHPAWFPNGTRIAFASARDGDFAIYPMRSDGTDVR